MIVAFAGRRAHALGIEQSSIVARIRRELESLSPSGVVGAAADGGDLLVLEVALALFNRPAVHLVLATSPEVFRHDSVALGWRARYDAVLGELSRFGDRVESLNLEPAEEQTYRRANQVIVDRALTENGTGGAVALMIAREGEGTMVSDLARRARRRGMPVHWIEPSSTRGTDSTAAQ